MGVDYSAVMCVGVIKGADELNLKRRERGCEHMHSTPFCPSCGKPQFVEKELRPWQVIDEANVPDDIIHEIWQDNLIVIGKYFSAGFGKDLPQYRTSRMTDEEYEALRKPVKEAVLALGLEWIEREFGVYVLPNAG